MKVPPGLSKPLPPDTKRHSSQTNWGALNNPQNPQGISYKSNSAYYEMQHQNYSSYEASPQAMPLPQNYASPQFPQQNMQYYQYEDLNNQFANTGPIQYAAIPVGYYPGYTSYSQPCYYPNQQPTNSLPSMKKPSSTIKKKSPSKSSQFKPQSNLNTAESEIFAGEVIKEFEENSSDFSILTGSIKIIAQTQTGSRFLQKQLSKGTPDFIEFVLKEIENSLPELMTNDYGNYFCQRLLFNCSPSHRLFFIKQIKGQIVAISKDSRGIHTIQSIFDVMTMEEEEIILANDLKGHVFELAMVNNIGITISL